MKIQESLALAEEEVNYLSPGKHQGIWVFLKTWALTVDHKRIGIMYFIAVIISFFVGGSFALLIRLELLSPAQILYTAAQYNAVFSAHGIIMIFLFIVPSIPATIGNFVLPLHIGAKDVAFPRLNLASLYLYLIGGGIASVAMILGRVDTGWTFYLPYAITSETAVLFVGVGLFIAGFSSILTGLNFMVTIHKLRAPGMTWMKMPLMVWALYSTSIIQVLATPVIAITLLLLLAEKLLGVGIFSADLGGDPVLFEHFFWFYSHPVVYVMILPAMGIMSELITTFSQRNIFGYKFVAFSSLAIALISFLVWGHHLFVSGQSAYVNILFSFLTFLVGIPSAVKLFNWTATLYKGSIRWRSPFLWAFAFMVFFAIGGLTGIILGLLPLDIHLHDTYYIVAHFHYTMVGGTVVAFIGGIHFWWPKMFGKLYSEFMAHIAFWIFFVGFNLSFLPQFVAGSKGMPRRYYTYLEEFTIYHQLSTFGSWLIALSIIMMFSYFVASLMNGEKAPMNPWGGKTLEWTAVKSPPDEHNFERVPVITHGPYNYESEEENLAKQNRQKNRGAS